MNEIFEYLEEDEVSQINEESLCTDLLSCLKEAYPFAGEDEILQFYNIATTHYQDKLPLTAAMQNYIYIDSKIKSLEKDKEGYRKTILEQFKIIDHPFAGIKCSKVKSRPINELKYYEWVKTLTTPEVLEECTEKVIDYKRFDELCAKGKITYDLDMIPDDLSITRESIRINVDKQK